MIGQRTHHNLRNLIQKKEKKCNFYLCAFPAAERNQLSKTRRREPAEKRWRSRDQLSSPGSATPVSTERDYRNMMGLCPAFLDDSASRKAGQRISTNKFWYRAVGPRLVGKKFCLENVKNQEEKQQKQKLTWIMPSSDSQVTPRIKNNISRVQDLKEKRQDFIEIPSIKITAPLK